MVWPPSVGDKSDVYPKNTPDSNRKIGRAAQIASRVVNLQAMVMIYMTII
jgi:hypothetical protein